MSPASSINSTSSIRHFDVDLDGDDCNDKIVRIALELRPEWASVRDQIRTRDFSGGITNRIVACYIDSRGVDTCDTMLFRIYGQNTEKFISREQEMANMRLCKAHGIGPDVYCKYNNGVCYEYLPGHIVEQAMMRDERVYTKIARATAKLHAINFDRRLTARESATHAPFIFAKIRELLALVKDDYAATMPDMTAELLGQIPSKTALGREIDSLERHVTEFVTRSDDSYLTFSHNDLLLGNIVYDRESDAINFIDYEYSGLNFQAYDLANHFNEFAGVESPDYSLFPDKAYQLAWIRTYLSAFLELTGLDADGPRLSDELVDRFWRETSKFTLTSHMMWAVWSLVQAQCSQLDFNFVKYAKIRFDEYFKNKDAFVAL